VGAVLASRPAVWAAPLLCVALAACSSSSGGASSTPSACVRPVASASAYDRQVTAAKVSAAAAIKASDKAAQQRALGTQGTLQLAWAKLITANPSCFPSDTVAAAKEYLSGHGG
jgi:hypothetical protein